MTHPVLFCTLVAVTCIQVVYFLSFIHTITFKGNPKKTNQKTPISVLIYAKNASKSLTALLPLILEQVYFNFEIILINDGSTDATLEIMECFRNEHSNIRIVNVIPNETFWGSKKYALTLGIKSASHEHLLLTNAHCKPTSKHWIQEFADSYSTEKQIVLGYHKYNKENTLINRFIRFETLVSAMQYMTYAKVGAAYMGNGSNIAYTKREFFKTNGFMSHMNLASGDVDLFIQEAATKNNTTYTINKNSFTESTPPSTFKAWFQEKRNAGTTLSFYTFKHKCFLSLFFLSKVLFYALTAILICFNWKLATPVALLYFSTSLITFRIYARQLEEKNTPFYMPLLEIALLLFQFSIFITNIFSKPPHWK